MPRRAICLAMALATSLSIGRAAEAQASRPPAPGPRLPGAATTMPAWLAPAPFDLKAYFRAPAPGRNAAPLYLEALAEFDGAMAACFPASERGRFAQVARRQEAAIELYRAAFDRGEAIAPARIDAALAGFEAGFRKLAEAQARPECVFETGISPHALLPHAQAAMTVARVAALRIPRLVEAGEVDAAVDLLGRVHRLGRDLRPRGALITQVVAVAVDGVCGQKVVPAILAAPGLTIAHCDRLLAALRAHEREALDPFAVGVMSEYVATRTVIRGVEKGLYPGRDGGERRLDGDGVVRLVISLLKMTDQPPEGLDDPETRRAFGKALDDAGFDAAASRRIADDFAATLLGPGAVTYTSRLRAIDGLSEKHQLRKPGIGPTYLLKLLTPDHARIALIAANGQFYVRASIALTALRRWELARGSAPSDLAAAAREAGLPAVPVDPFTGGTLKLTTRGDELVVYSVGPDGLDDKGRTDALRSTSHPPLGDYPLALPRRAAPAR